MSKFQEPCFLLVDQKKTVCCIPCNSKALSQIVSEGYSMLRHNTLKELDQTIHEYVKRNFREDLHEEDMTDEH